MRDETCKKETGLVMITLKSRAQNEAIAPPIECPVTMMPISP